MELSPNQRVAGILLGEPVHDWIATQRKRGLSWRLIARALYEQTSGQVDVTHETVRLWAAERQGAA